MGIFTHFLHQERLRFSNIIHAVRDDVASAERWVRGHAVVPAAHLVSGIGQQLGGFERHAESEIRSLATGVASAEHSIVNGVEHGYHAIQREVKGVGQVLGGIGHRVADDASAVWSFGERMGRGLEGTLTYLPVALAGGAIVWLGRSMAR